MKEGESGMTMAFTIDELRMKVASRGWIVMIATVRTQARE
uniref:Uncharacterized protein n=1 Tax=Peronospora matthiolae TaxID=2874970 RepID=A0AAV1U079_9STRA